MQPHFLETRVDDVWGTVVRYTMSAHLHAANLHGKDRSFQTRIFIWVNMAYIHVAYLS